MGEIQFLELGTHFNAQIEALFEVKLVHVFKNFLFLVTTNALVDRVENFFIHGALKLSDLCRIQNGLALRKFIVIFGSEVLQ